MKQKDLSRLERELKHYSSTYRYANKEGKEQLSLHIWKLRQAIACAAPNKAIAEHNPQVDEEPPEPPPIPPHCPNCGVSADSLDDRACWNCGATIPL